ncbi:hypothetical protein Y032_0102g3445 [Ancylostoma ceylanicum]|nr:hypothetical protein Y032_0102g3445 [Ancylostoma ceylanicum]
MKKMLRRVLRFHKSEAATQQVTYKLYSNVPAEYKRVVSHCIACNVVRTPKFGNARSERRFAVFSFRGCNSPQHTDVRTELEVKGRSGQGYQTRIPSFKTKFRGFFNLS